MFIFLILRGITKKRLMQVGQTKVKILMQTLKFLKQCLNLLLESKRNMFLCISVTFVVFLVTLDHIVLRNTYVTKFVLICHFCNVSRHIRHNCHKLKFKHSVFQSRICDYISPATSPEKLFHMLLKNLSQLAWKRSLQDFSLSQKKYVISQIHFVSHDFSPTKPKMCAIQMRKDLLK